MNSMPKRSKEEQPSSSRKKTYHNDTPQERSVRKKTEKLWQCTAEIEKEMMEVAKYDDMLSMLDKYFPQITLND